MPGGDIESVLMLDGDVYAKNGRRAFQSGSWGEL